MLSHRHLCSAFIQRSNEQPNSNFVTMVGRRGEQAYSNRFVLSRALDVGDSLAAKGIVPGDLVIIVLDHRVDLYATFLGCMIRGFVPSFLPPLTPKQDPSVFQRSMACTVRSHRTEGSPRIRHYVTASARGGVPHMSCERNSRDTGKRSVTLSEQRKKLL